MGRVFDYDGPLMGSLSKVADLLILNMLTLLFCIPLVTIGASLTASHYVALKLRRGEGYVWKNFWKSFRENFKQSTIMWLMFIVCIFVHYFAYRCAMVVMTGTASMLICTAIFVFTLFVLMTSLWVFPMQARFVNNISSTIKNSFIMAFKYVFRTLLMLCVSFLPVVILEFLSYNMYWILFCFGFSVPIYICAMLYDKKFKMIEEMIEDREREENGEVI